MEDKSEEIRNHVNRDNIYSNNVLFENGEIRIEYPYEYDSSFYGIAKGDIVKKYKEKGYEVIFIGDGVADIEASKHADKLFAKVGRRLEKHCVENGIEFVPYRDFRDIIENSFQKHEILTSLEAILERFFFSCSSKF